MGPRGSARPSRRCGRGGGTPIRLTGQDTERGRSVRGAAPRVHDIQTGKRHRRSSIFPTPRAHSSCTTALSEYACLGFEYGYAVEAQNDAGAWEAQFGDFANGAEVIIDQFLIAGWRNGRDVAATLLLPHG